jgi:hypothetical protein
MKMPILLGVAQLFCDHTRRRVFHADRVLKNTKSGTVTDDYRDLTAVLVHNETKTTSKQAEVTAKPKGRLDA